MKEKLLLRGPLCHNGSPVRHCFHENSPDVDLEQDYVVKTSKTGGSAMPAMMLTAAVSGNKAQEAGQATGQAKGAGGIAG